MNQPRNGRDEPASLGSGYLQTFGFKRSVNDRAAERADYAAWKIMAGADLLQRHDVKPGIIPERLWRKFYIQGLSPQKAADQAAAMSAAARLRKLRK
jgi:hypothetical protein